MHRLFTSLTYIVIPLAAFLTFMLQPVAGKLLLPVYGGSTGTWLTLSMFFQGALLAGYALAWIGLKKYRMHGVMAGLALLAPLSLALPLRTVPGLAEWPGVLASLGISLLPTVLLTTSCGLVIQGWIERMHGRIPYHLYAISNIGGIVALLAYPFLIEPNLGLATQMFILKILVWVLAAGLLVLCWLCHQQPAPQGESMAAENEPFVLTKDTIVAWILLSFSTNVLALGATTVLSAEFGSNPLTWLLPLGIFLGSFSIAFSGWWRPSLNYVALVGLGGGLFGFMQVKGIGPSYLDQWGRLWLVVILASGCLSGLGFLYQLRPPRRPMSFYTAIAGGGLAAGIFVSAIAPALLSRTLEFTGAAFFLLTFLSLQLLSRRQALARYSLVMLIVAPSAWFGINQIMSERGGPFKSDFYRNTYGTLLLMEDPQKRRWLSHESTLHGDQLLVKQYRRTPTSYYNRGSAIGIAIYELQKKQPSVRLGAIGLGTGTVAAYGRAEDHFVFWDINPLAIEIARKCFYYLKDCPAKVDVFECDGRLGLAAHPGKFDIILVDAFAGDSIPAHLITQEALAQYLACLDENGILLTHISSRNLDLFPIVNASARAAGWRSLRVTTTPRTGAIDSHLSNSSTYAVIFKPQRETEILGWFETRKTESGYELMIEDGKTDRLIQWTDDRNAIMDLLNWDNLLHR